MFGGTWERIKDRFLLGASDTYVAGNVGGSTTHSHSLSDRGMATIGNYADTVAFRSSSSGWQVVNEATSGINVYGWTHNHDTGYGLSNAPGNMVNVVMVGLRGNTDNQTTLPPYIAVYMWKRTA